ncbi:VOC family protein [Chelativorans sp. Marseille-P2723]|uniref:VOC family protein n=1 Tax=Chelativorans sp. Marseille-P2723 TaxID=2709133 RepID=UPI00156EAD4A|nr:VOC family protein [Chelativorans sp. Marseille-P2723]
MTHLPFAAATPVRIASVALKARDADALAQFYRTVVGLDELGRSNGSIQLGAGGRHLLTIEAAPDAKPDNPREAGLFHTAFLLPSRKALAQWARRAVEEPLPIDGASDHLVSEAIYLTDPEGNGIEIYADRPREQWLWEGDEVSMKTLRLNFEDLLAEGGDDPWKGAPDGTVIGHVHLRVGDPAEAERWWHETIGLDVMARYGPQAVFLASGGYHHHVGANSWHSRGAGRRDPARTGLAWIELHSSEAGEERLLEDPWGTAIRLVPSSGA